MQTAVDILEPRHVVVPPHVASRETAARTATGKRVRSVKARMMGNRGIENDSGGPEQEMIDKPGETSWRRCCICSPANSLEYTKSNECL
jgi:hypothetical protein